MDLLALVALSPFYDDPYMKAMQAYDATDNELPQDPIAPPTILPPSPVLSLSPMFDSRHFFPPKNISPPKDAETPVESPILISLSLSVGSSSPMPPKRTSTSAALAMTQAAIRQLVVDSVDAALEAQAATMASTDNPNRNTRPRETLVARKVLTKSLMEFAQPFYINGIGRSCWSSFVGLRLLTNKYCPRTEVKKIEDEFYNVVVKGNDLKTYARRFQELAVLCPNMVPNTKKLMEAYGTKPRSIEGNVTASKLKL
ncbi:hypothetical protein Tco_0393304 [Tanacetum coccineum]